MKHLSATPLWQEIQRALGLDPDGIPGNQTAHAVARALRLPVATEASIWPRDNDDDLVRFYGPPGTGLTSLDMPFPLRLAWEPTTEVLGVTCHRKVMHPLKRVWSRALEHYGYERVRELRLDLFGGCFNKRKKRGGTTWSVHAFGAAWDVDPAHNELRWGRDKASLAGAEYDAFWRIVESEGGVSLGRRKNYDWQHFQFAIV